MSRRRNWCLTYNIPDAEDYAVHIPIGGQPHPNSGLPAAVPRDGSPRISGELPGSPSDRRDEDHRRRSRSPVAPAVNQMPPSEEPRSPSENVHDAEQPAGDGGQMEHDAGSIPDYSSFISLKDDLRYAIWSLERAPSTGRLHVQGYLEFKVGMRLSAVQRFLSADTCHLEGRRGTRYQAIEYCRKSDSHVAGPWEVGHSGINPGKRTDLHEITDRICGGLSLGDMVEEYPVQFVRYGRGLKDLYHELARQRQSKWREVQVMVYWGDTGTGKTRLAVEEGGDSLYSLPQGDRFWLDGYEGQRTLLIDDYYGWIKYGLFLKLLDGHKISLPVKGGFVPAEWTKVIITSNKSPASWYSFGITPAFQRRLDTGVTKHFSSLVN